MLTVAAPDGAEARSNATFEALMWSMARPGEVRALPEAGLGGIIEALIDLECTVFADSADLMARVAQTGARLTRQVEEADHVFVDTLGGTAWLEALRCGSALYPDDGATLAVRARHDGEYRLRLTGPGVERTREVSLSLPPEFWALRAQLCAYPEGFDLLLVDDDAVIGIPRSTMVEVL